MTIDLFGPSKPEEAKSTAGEVGKYAGFDSLQAARDAQAATPVSSKPASTRAPRKTYGSPATAAPTLDEIKRAELKAKAFETIGKNTMKQVAQMPYEMWAFAAADPSLRLTDDERDELTESYFLLAQTLDPDFSSKWFILFSIFASNVRIAYSKWQMHEQREATKREQAKAANAGGHK